MSLLANVLFIPNLYSYIIDKDLQRSCLDNFNCNIFICGGDKTVAAGAGAYKLRTIDFTGLPSLL
ncbi:hypothetical protein BH23THE1_BH23THE1_20010 [soil metagenome]